MVLATLLPWAAVLLRGIAWTKRHYGWLALFYLLVLSQVGHVAEHVAQMVQLHHLELRPEHAHGVFGALDVEWVHFVWNSWILAAVGLLAFHFPRNGWLWVVLPIALWHEAEHAYIISVYLATGQAGSAGLLAAGGVLGVGLLKRPELHFVYNLMEIVPLAVGFVVQWRRSHAHRGGGQDVRHGAAPRPGGAPAPGTSFTGSGPPVPA